MTIVVVAVVFVVVVVVVIVVGGGGGNGDGIRLFWYSSLIHAILRQCLHFTNYMLYNY